MHIAYITSHFPFKNAKSVGGIGTSIYNLGVELIKLGHQVTVFVYEQELDETIIVNGIQICKIRNIKFKGLSWYLTRKKIQHKIEQLNKIKQIDIIEAPDWCGISSFVKTVCPIVIKLHGSDTYFCYLENRKSKLWNRFLEKKALKSADAIIAVSDFTGKMTNKIFNLTKAYKVIPNGVDTNLFLPKRRVSEQQAVLYFGGIIRKKGVLEIPHYFNEISKDNPNVQLFIIGKDMPDIKTNTASTKDIITNLLNNTSKKNTHFVGSVSHSEIMNYINEATICIFPSYAEALPVSWLEAMSCGKVIVASDIGWSHEIIDDEKDGFKINPKDFKKYANVILDLLNNEEKRTFIEENARKKILDKFSIEKVANESEIFYKNVILNANTKGIYNKK